jgi:hypothetical protein
MELRKIYINSPDTSSLEMFILHLFDICGRVKLTFNDPECLCEEFRKAYRSFPDIYLICKTYFPEVTQEEVKKAIITLGHSYYEVGTLFCNDIKKWVFYRTGKSLESHQLDMNEKLIAHNEVPVNNLFTKSKLKFIECGHNPDCHIRDMHVEGVDGISLEDIVYYKHGKEAVCI